MAGETGNALRGVSRGRGFRGRRGRGFSRASSTAAQQTTEDGPESPQESPRTAQLKQPTPLTDKNSAALTARSKVKTPRKPLRSEVAPRATDGHAVPPTTKFSDRRRRSQTIKPNDPAISPFVSAERQSLVIPEFAQPEDSPLVHQRADLRQDIDALVERVRAVAMDTRSSTPGSHIDWADDDDTLPDLNDWGVTTLLPPKEITTISPIILEGLKTLPEFSVSSTSSPLQQVYQVPCDVKRETLPSGREAPAVVPFGRLERQATVVNTRPASKNLDPQTESLDHPLPSKPADSSFQAKRKSWHPSLPAKPSGSHVSQMSSRSSATPTRLTPFTKPILSESAVSQIGSALKQAARNSSTETKVPEIVSAITRSEADGRSISPRVNSGSETPLDVDDDSKVEGLAASMHAPKSSESVATHSLSGQRHWYDKKNRNNRISRDTNGDNVNPVKQWNNRRGSKYPPRDRSSNAPDSNHLPPSHSSRPVITGDAISRLARTIGHTNPTN